VDIINSDPNDGWWDLPVPVGYLNNSNLINDDEFGWNWRLEI
jgi:hypothetical protein